MFQEYPKCLNHNGLTTVVFDAAQEELARADGFLFHAEIEVFDEVVKDDFQPKRRGRPAKAKE
jgi:hypothetical protein